MESLFLRDWIIDGAKTLGINLVELEKPEGEAVRDALGEKFGNDQQFELTWANIKDRSSIQHPDSWLWIDEFLSDEPVYLFYDREWNDKDSSVFLIPSGKDVVKLLEECPGFVFYVTNKAMDYVLCQNDHDYLIGSGTAKDWVTSLEPRHEEWAASLRERTDSKD